MKQYKKIKLFLLVGICSWAITFPTHDLHADSKEALAYIKTTIDSDATLGPHEIDVYYRQRSVILKGQVASEKARDRIVEIAKSANGVETVTDWLSVKNRPDENTDSDYIMSRNDNHIESDIRSAIAADSKYLGNKVSVSVRNGTATLSGNLKNFREIDQVLSTTLMVAGVQDVYSELTINGQPYGVQKYLR